MGIRFRKSKKFGPFRITLSKSGLSSSVGVKGFRVTKMANGRTRATASIPGTGISYIKEVGGKKPPNVTKQTSEIEKPQAVKTPLHSTPAPARKKNRVPLLFAIVGALCVVLFLNQCSGNKTAKVEITSAAVSTAVPAPSPSPDDKLLMLAPVEESAEVLDRALPAEDTITTPEPTAAPTPVTHTYVLNTNTNIFHYPDCKSVKKMKEKNMQIVESSREEIIAAGYDPCGNCHP